MICSSVTRPGLRRFPARGLRRLPARGLRRLPARGLRRLPARVMLAGAAALVLAGCSSGQQGTTGNQVAAVNGGTGKVGDVSVRDATIGFPTGDESFWAAGEDAPLLFTIANAGLAPDELVAISTPAANDVQVTGNQRLPGNNALRSEPADGTAAGLGTSSRATASAEPPSSSGEPSSGEAATTRTAGAEPELGYLSVELTDLTTDVRPGLTIDVTFSFAEAGDVTLKVPVGAPDEPPAER